MYKQTVINEAFWCEETCLFGTDTSKNHIIITIIIVIIF